jgi:hypothetical protein
VSESAIGHSPSHRGLLQPSTPQEVDPAPIDALIVPTARTAPYLRRAIAYAASLRCPLIALCSGRAKFRAVKAEVSAADVRIDFVGVDLTSRGCVQLPDFSTSQMLAGTKFERRTDTSLKRNVGLALARMVGLSRVAFLDDDIDLPSPLDLERAAGLLARHDSVGLHIGGYPDNSVVCHAHRDAGGWQDTFVGGGALVVPTDRFCAFFPEIYNEDWFFLLDSAKLRHVTQIGHAWQQPYDPFADPDRARGQEFGDVLAEGIYALLDRGRRVQDADETYWERFLRSRGRFLADIIERVERTAMEPTQRFHVLAALKAARGRLAHITPGLCTQYLKAWQVDRTRWRNYLNGLGSALEIEVALKDLGIEDYCVNRNAERAYAA